MKKIRTILAYYNGEKFIDEQLQSIVDQEIPEGYEHEILVCDDGSKNESSRYLAKRWGHVVKIKKQKNKGVFLTFLEEFANAIDNKVDVVFFADQDDIYKKNKYASHIAKHVDGNVFVCSNSVEWFWDKNEISNMRLNLWSGHRISVATHKVNVDTAKLRDELQRISHTRFVKRYHDTFLGYWFAILCEVEFIPEVLTFYRAHSSSVSRTEDKCTYKMWKDDYEYFFMVMKPFWQHVYNKKLSIRKYNKGLYIYDVNYFKIRILSWIRYHWNNFWMYVRVKKMRNI